MKSNIIQFDSILTIFTVLALLSFNSCTKSAQEIFPIEETEEQTEIDPADANALSKVLILPESSNIASGNSPESSNDSNAPKINSQINTIVSSNGSTALLNFNYENVQNNLGGCYFRVEGSDDYYTIPYEDTSNNEGMLQLPIGIPTNVLAGQFCIYFCVFDDNGLVSNNQSVCITVERLGTGALQISLSWDTQTDQDLHVVDPSGFNIYYADSYSTATGGQLDRDDTYGYGPENIFWVETAPDGEYEIRVHDYEGTSFKNNFSVTVSTKDSRRTFEGFTINNEYTDVVKFRKDGDQIIF